MWLISLVLIQVNFIGIRGRRARLVQRHGAPANLRSRRYKAHQQYWDYNRGYYEDEEDVTIPDGFDKEDGTRFTVSSINVGGINTNPWEFINGDPDQKLINDIIKNWYQYPVQTKKPSATPLLSAFLPGETDQKDFETFHIEGYTIGQLINEAYTTESKNPIKSEKLVKIFGHFDRNPWFNPLKSPKAKASFLESAALIVNKPKWKSDPEAQWEEEYKGYKDVTGWEAKWKAGQPDDGVLNVGGVMKADSVLKNKLGDSFKTDKGKLDFLKLMQKLYCRIIWKAFGEYVRTKGSAGLEKMKKVFGKGGAAEELATSKKKKIQELIKVSDVTFVQEFMCQRDQIEALEGDDVTVFQADCTSATDASVIVVRNAKFSGETFKKWIPPALDKLLHEDDAEPKDVLYIRSAKYIFGSFHASGSEYDKTPNKCGKWMKVATDNADATQRVLVGADCNENIYGGADLDPEGTDYKKAEKMKAQAPLVYEALQRMDINPHNANIKTTRKTRSYLQSQIAKVVPDISQKDYFFSIGFERKRGGVYALGETELRSVGATLESVPEIPSELHPFDHFLLLAQVSPKVVGAVTRPKSAGGPKKKAPPKEVSGVKPKSAGAKPEPKRKTVPKPGPEGESLPLRITRHKSAAGPRTKTVPKPAGDKPKSAGHKEPAAARFGRFGDYYDEATYENGNWDEAAKARSVDLDDRYYNGDSYSRFGDESDRLDRLIEAYKMELHSMKKKPRHNRRRYRRYRYGN